MVQQYWELCLTTSRSWLCWWPSLMGITHHLPPLCSLLLPLPPIYFACYEGLHFNTHIFLKGMSCLRCRLLIAVAQGMAQAKLAVKALLLWRYFHLCIKNWSVIGGSKRAWVIAGYFTEICARHRHVTPVEGPPGCTSEQILEKCKVPKLDPLFCFSMFYQHQFDNWLLHPQ